MDQYDYVTYGKVFKIESFAAAGGAAAAAGASKEPKVAIMISFGGLLMKLSGDQKYVCIHIYIYCVGGGCVCLILAPNLHVKITHTHA